MAGNVATVGTREKYFLEILVKKKSVGFHIQSLLPQNLYISVFNGDLNLLNMLASC